MFSTGIFGGEPRHIRRARAYLQEARMAMLEHSIAAEHYQASAQMYADRARRLEEEIAAWEGGGTVEEGGSQMSNLSVSSSQPVRSEDKPALITGCQPAAGAAA